MIVDVSWMNQYTCSCFRHIKLGFLNCINTRLTSTFMNLFVFPRICTPYFCILRCPLDLPGLKFVVLVSYPGNLEMLGGTWMCMLCSWRTGAYHSDDMCLFC